MSAGVDRAVVLYYSFVPAHVGYHLVGCTSEASPLFAGIVAMTDQLSGRPVGNINGALYALSNFGRTVDVTQGNNTFGPFTNSDGKTYTVVGLDAGPGYDWPVASGRSTPRSSYRRCP